MAVNQSQTSTRKHDYILCFVLCFLFGGGCAGSRPGLFSKKPEVTGPPPVESMVLHGDQLEPAKLSLDSAADTKLAEAHELYRRNEYSKAEDIFHKIAENTKNSVQVAEEARYYEAECLRRRMKYPKAADTYNRMLTDFPSGAHREQALQHMYEIANYWLEDTRTEMREEREKKEGKRWIVWPGSPVHLETTKPLFDQEGRAVEKLEQVNLNNINGPLADHALFLLGSVKFYREDYKEADYFFSQLVEMHPNSQFASRAVELAIISKHMSTGGSDYDGRKVAEARDLVHKALHNYPDLAAQKSAFLDRQLAGINKQQAEKDYKIAEFYRRTGHPGSAYFYYEIVRRRYPGSKFFDMATERMHDLRAKMERKHKEVPGVPEARRPGENDDEEAGPPPRKLPPLDPQELNGTEQAPAPRKLPPPTDATPQPPPPNQ